MADAEIRFRWGGCFVTSNGETQYTGGLQGRSSIDADKLSLPELKDYMVEHVPALKNHTQSKELVLSWKPAGSGSADLVALDDDNGVFSMISSYEPGQVVDVYVELPKFIQHQANAKQKGIPDGGREKVIQEKQTLAADPQPLPDEVVSQIDNILKEHLNRQLYSNFELNTDELLLLRAALKQNNYVETKFRSWFTILDAIQAGRAIDDVVLPQEDDSFPSYSMGQINRIITLINEISTDDSPFDDTFGAESSISPSISDPGGSLQVGQPQSFQGKETSAGGSLQVGQPEESQGKETYAGGSLLGGQPQASQGKQLRKRGVSRRQAPLHDINALPTGSYEVGGRFLRARQTVPQETEVGERVIPRKKDPQKSQAGNTGAPSADVRSREEQEKRSCSKKLADTQKQAKGRFVDGEQGHRGRSKKPRNPLPRNQVEQEDRVVKNKRKSPKKSKGLPRTAEARSVDDVDRSPPISKGTRKSVRKNNLQSDAAEARSVDDVDRSPPISEGTRKSARKNKGQSDAAEARSVDRDDRSSILQSKSKPQRKTIAGRAADLSTSSDEHVMYETRSNDNDNHGSENMVVPGTPSTDQGKLLAHTDRSSPEDEFLGFEFHGIHKNELTKESLMFDSVGKWLTPEQYLCILYNVDDFIKIDDEKDCSDYLLGVVTMPKSFLPAWAGKDGNWNLVSDRALKIRETKLVAKFYEWDSPIGRLQRRAWTFDLSALVHTRCFEPKISNCPAVHQEIGDLRNRVREVFDRLRTQDL